MAEALLSPLFNMILENLHSHVLKEFGILSGLKADIETLKSNFTAIQAVLQDAESKQWTSQAVKDWLKKLKSVAYDLDSILDEISTEALIRTMNHQRGLKHRIDALFSYRNPILFRFKMIKKVKEIKKRLDAIADEKSKFHFKQGIMSAEEVVVVDSRLTSSLVIESEIIGRDDEKEMIIEKIVNNNSGDDLAVYAIHGMGGLGKTTLAQLVYNDERVKENFDLKIWVCVSDDFNIRRLIGAIIESIEGSHCSITELDPLQLRLHENLKGKRYLLVLDDVWNEIHENWEGFKKALNSGVHGITVIVTTRLENVARMMATYEVHQMGYLSEEDSWCLFKRRAFGTGGAEENVRLEVIGKEIVKKCGGLPLAIKSLGSLMRLKRSESQWLFVKESKIWELSADGSSILPVLRLSFDNLPMHSKRCFAYCCVFPKDYVMERDVLIFFWMANGFLLSRGQSDLFAVGREIFDDLVWRSFFQDVKEENGSMECKMHDLIHDLAQFVTADECLIFEHDQSIIIPEELRHLYFLSPSILYTGYIPNGKSVRTLVLKPEALRAENVSLKDVFSLCISRYREVRYLHFQPSGSYSFVNHTIPKSIRNLIHLRYLNLSTCPTKSLPESICYLQNMQTLILRYCAHLLMLPKGMKYMKNLQCLDIRDCYSLVSMPAGMGQLTRLQTMTMFIVSQARGCQINELQELDLQGELRIKGLANASNSVDTNGAILKNKDKLSYLSLYWAEGSLPENAEQVFESLQPHSNLKKLSVYGYPGSRLPNWITSSLVLENLVGLELKYFERCEDVPSLWKLPFLENVYFKGLHAIKSFNNKFHGDGEISFPALKVLTLNDMASLEEWKRTPKTIVGGQSSFPCLQELHISDCPKLTEMPSHLPRLEVLEMSGINQVLVGQVMNITSISKLYIAWNDELIVLPNELLKNHMFLKDLMFTNLSNLKTLSHELDNLTTLKSLSIKFCPSLKSLPEGLKNLECLEILRLYNCDIMESLTEGVRHLTALQMLMIKNCPEMKCLPDGLQSLSKLKTLVIEDCPYLTTRCKKDTGEDWPKISHIRWIKIDRKRIQDTGEDWPKNS